MTSADESTPDDGPAPAEVERVPLKVVPIFVQPIEDEPEPDDDDDVIPDEEAEPRRSIPFVAIAAVVLALATVGVHVAALVVASAGDFPTGTLLGYIAIGISGLTVVVGVVAAIIGRGRAWAIGAAVVGLLANPFLLLAVLRLLSGLQTS